MGKATSYSEKIVVGLNLVVKSLFKMINNANKNSET